jgi:glycosyltransferase involved in cell wall biosynthesis
VMEAALCATPSAALAVGGLRESIVDGQTGLLARDAAGLTENIRRLVSDAELRERLGAAARERAIGFTWDRTASTTLSVVQSAVAAAGARRAPRG